MSIYKKYGSLLSVLMKKWNKFARFVQIYGLSRTIVKSFGRKRDIILPIHILYQKHKPDTLLIGCGQFAFSTICYFLRKNRGNRFLKAYDLDPDASSSLANFFRFRHLALTPSDIFDKSAKGDYLYIASNHASHAQYAIQGLKNDLNVYVEKPIAVEYNSLVGLIAASQKSKGNLYAGYNRPYSSAIKNIKEILLENALLDHNGHRFNVSFFINGHVIPSGHWYRDLNEGTRICGNVGHWIDLTMHLFNWRSIPDIFEVFIVYSNIEEPDDNITITIKSNLNDLVTISLVSQSEPFEGISESINLQYGDLIARIDDFQSLKVWVNEKKYSFKYFPKDVGHQRAVMQPFLPKEQNRDFFEVTLSTLLMLEITEMVRSTEGYRIFNVPEKMNDLNTAIVD
jgi:predicted dehydrogenase